MYNICMCVCDKTFNFSMNFTYKIITYSTDILKNTLVTFSLLCILILYNL